MFDFEVDTK